MDESRMARLARIKLMTENARLDFNVVSADQETPNKPQIQAVKLGEEKTVRGAKVEKKVQPEIPVGPQYQPTEFLQAVKFAGFVQAKREGEPVFRPDGSPVMIAGGDYSAKRKDEIAALRRFGGYDPKLNHGEQLANAMRKARLALDPALGGDGRVKRTAPTVAGFVAGVCDHSAKVKAHLDADLRRISESIAFYSKPGVLTPCFNGDGTPRMDEAGFQVKVPIDEDDRLGLLELYEEELAEVRKALVRAG